MPNLHGGGGERVMVMTANGLQRLGYSVDLVAGRYAGPYAGLVKPEIRAVDLGHERMLVASVALGWYLRRCKPDAVLATLDWVNVLTLLAAECMYRPARLVLREATHHGARFQGTRTRSEYALEKLIAATYPRADVVVAVSEGVRHDLVNRVGLDPARVAVVFGPHFDENLMTSAAEQPSHPWLQGNTAPIVVGAGRLGQEKDFATLLRAFALVRRQRSARLIVLGEGPERAALESLAASLGIAADVSFPGFVLNPFAVFARASVFVLSSRFEGLPGVLVQAMACGCPVVSTDCESGPREVLEGGRWGPLVPVGDPEALAAAMMGVLNAPPAREGLRARAAAFSADVATVKYAALLDPEGYADMGPNSGGGRKA